ncbi:MAG: pyridoxal phosphate-dependent aminotransferase [Clostridiales Family XIII bacterium]|jgi:alanine-synthesizing transaminase|nr:pyridoxal phosphate-dependent aminotransferase [Clostridiales Family XIII bacterium]
MRLFNKTSRLDNVGYDIRGPVSDEASRMMREGIDILQLNTGNPAKFGLYAPKYIEEEICKRVRSAEGYSDSHGIDEAIDAIIRYSESKGVHGLGFEDVFTGNGVSELINTAVQALLNDGDEVLVPSPDYPLWTSLITLCGGKAVHYVCDESSDWVPDIDDIRAKVSVKTKAIVVINPNNPTGALYDTSILQEIIEIARERELILFADEIYDRLVMDGLKHVSLASLSDDVLTITFNGLSKSHMIAGFRCAWMTISGPKHTAKSYICGIAMLSSMRLCSNVLAQSVIKVALDDAYWASDLLAPGGRIYEQRKVICDAINSIDGLSTTIPKAGFYIFPRIDTKKYKIIDDEKFVLDFLKAHHVLMTHGRGFHYPRADHFRIVFLPQPQELQTLSSKLGTFLETYSQ